jgi:uncharacterized protein YbjT (DUF2867 family)
MAREAGVEHYIYTSVGSANKQTGVPHFDNKWRIEETVRSLRFRSHVTLRPVFFMENLLAPFSLQGSTLAWALEHARLIVNATDLPPSADLENGFGDAPEIVAETIRLAAGVGLIGCTIDDASGAQ